MVFKMVRAALALACVWALSALPVAAQTTETFSAYIIGLPAASAPTGAEKMFAIQSGAPVSMTPYQILSLVAGGDCSIASPPSIVCTKTNGVAFAPSATIDTTNAANISGGSLALARLLLATGHIYVGNGSGNPADVSLSGDCTITSGGVIACSPPSSRLPAPFTSGTASGTTSQFATVATGAKTATHVATWDASGNIQDGGAAGAGTLTEQKNTATTGLSTSGNCDNIGTNASSPCNYALALTNATLQASPINPANLTSASFLMEGFGSTCHITPTYSGRIHVSFNFDAETGTAGVTLTTKVMFGTGTAPANSAAVTGTQVGNLHSPVQQVGGDFATVTHGAYVITGLTPGTAYWLDIAAQGDGTHAFAMADVSCSAMEF